MDMGTDAIIVRIRIATMWIQAKQEWRALGVPYLVIAVYSGANTALSLASKGWGRFASSSWSR
jgi:hypothetical protein